jgi:hypothetical protein
MELTLQDRNKGGKREALTMPCLRNGGHDHDEEHESMMEAIVRGIREVKAVCTGLITS